MKTSKGVFYPLGRLVARRVKARVAPALCYDCGRAEGGDVVFVACDNTAGNICNDCAAAALAELAEDGDAGTGK